LADSFVQELYDVDDQGTPTGLPYDARVGDCGAARSGRHPRVRRARLRDRSDAHAREHALNIGLLDPPSGVSPEEARDAIMEVLDSIGDTCHECPE
jgi:hypothetical protein